MTVAKSKKTLPASQAPASEFPSATALAQLMDVVKRDAPKGEKVLAAWSVVLRASANAVRE